MWTIVCRLELFLLLLQKIADGKTEGKVVDDQHYFGFPPIRYKLKFNKNVLIL